MRPFLIESKKTKTKFTVIEEVNNGTDYLITDQKENIKQITSKALRQYYRFKGFVKTVTTIEED